MKNFSLDVEGLSSDPGGVLLSIGLYEVKGLETKPNPDNMFLVNVDIQSCLDAGLKVNGDTIKWWFGQLDAARNALWEPKPMKLTTAASKLQKWYDEHKEKGEKAQNHVWAHATYDFPFLTCALHAVKKDVPWHYRDCKDLRTLLGFYSGPPLEDMKRGSAMEHSAAWDAFAQGQDVARSLQHIQIEDALRS
jgi:hypothetical protein